MEFTNRDRLNAIGAEPLQAVEGQTLVITGAEVERRADVDGQVIEVGYLKTDDGKIYTTISNTVVRAIEPLIAYADEEGLDKVEVRVAPRKSKNGRTFFLLELV